MNAVRAVIITALVLGSTLLFLCLLSAYKGREYRQQHMRFAILLLVTNLANSFFGSLSFGPDPATRAGQMQVCGVDSIEWGSFFGVLLAEIAILYVALHDVTTGDSKVSHKIEVALHTVVIGGTVIASAVTSAYCFAHCVQSTQTEPNKDLFFECWQHDIWYTSNIVWLGFLTVPVGLWTALFIRVRRVVSNNTVEYDPHVDSRADYGRRMQLLRLQQTVVRDIYKPIKWYPPAFLFFGAIFGVYTILMSVSLKIADDSHIDSLYALKPISIALIYFYSTPRAWANTKLIFKACIPTHISRRGVADVGHGGSASSTSAMFEGETEGAAVRVGGILGKKRPTTRRVRMMDDITVRLIADSEEEEEEGGGGAV